MRYGNRPLGKRFISSPIAMIGVLLLFILLARATWNMRDKSITSALKLSQVKSEYDKLDIRERDLSSRIDYLSTEQGVEAELKTKFRAVKDGESVAVIIDPADAATSTGESAAVISTIKTSWWQRMLQSVGL